VVSIGWPGVSAAATLNVPGDFATIQACIDAAVSGVDECVVDPGTYHETINFLGKAIAVRSSGRADVTTIDATGIGGSVVTCASGEGPGTVFDGFTITGGTGTADPYGFMYGGGMFNDRSSPTVTNCTFSGNSAKGGGGMYNDHSSPTVTNCKFGANIANAGGGMYNRSSSPTVTNCTFSGNTGYSHGGGMINSQSSPTVTNCTFNGNTATRGGGMSTGGGTPTVYNCTFSANTAGWGGGMYNIYGYNPTVAKCTFSENVASNGGIGGGIYNIYGTSSVTNCILWRDIPQEITIDSSVLIISFSDVQGGLPVGATDGGGNVDLDAMFVRPPDPGPDGVWDGVDDDYGDLRLRGGSPCIDAGDPGFVAQPGETDLEGHARVLCGRVDMGAYEFGIGDYDCDQVVDPADFSSWQACMTNPNATAVSAVPSHEATEPRSHEGAIDIRQSTIRCEGFDFDGDGDVDLLDFGGFQGVFGP